MKSELKKLINLSIIDEEIDLLSNQKETLPTSIKEYEKKLTELLQSLESRKNDLLGWKKEQKQKELDLASHKETIEKRELQLKEIKTNREYHAVLKEVTQVKKEVATLEEDILALIGKIEEETPKIDEMKKSLSDQKQALENEIGEKKDEIGKIDGQISEKLKQRLESEKELSETTLKKYKTIKARITPVLAKADDGNCLECYTKIPPQLFIELLKLKHLCICPRCHRILYPEIESNTQ